MITFASVMRIFTVFAFLMIAFSSHATTRISYPGGRQYMFRLTLTDKLHSPYRIDRPTRWLSAESVKRRKRQGLSLDSTDLPVSPAYIDSLMTMPHISIVGTSRWNNTVVVHTCDSAISHRLSQLSFVRHTTLVWISPDSIEKQRPRWTCHDYYNPWDSIKQEYYGCGKEQIEYLNGHRLHNIEKQGQDMTIAVLDGGFQNVNRILAFQNTNIVGTHDFIWHNPQIRFPEGQLSLYSQGDHGTRVLSALAATSPQVLVGTAPKANYWLLRCEDQESEQPVEEDYWVMAAEMADSAGVDIINSSLGYSSYDAPHPNIRLNDLDGHTTLISRTASLLASKGIILVNSAGNTGMGPWKKICVPADADDILTVGALNPQGKNAPFSSIGPSQDGRVKPDVMAYGSPATLISGRGSIVRDMGTSFAAPIVCGLVACLWQSLPSFNAREIIQLIRQTSDNYATPNNIYGYGKPNFWRAYMIGSYQQQQSHE